MNYLTLSILRRSFVIASGPLLSLGLAACQPEVPDLDVEDSETDGGSGEEPSSTSSGTDGDDETPAGLDTGSSGTEGSEDDMNEPEPEPLPGVPVLTLGFSPIKQFDFAWAPVAGADYYQLFESARPGEPFEPVTGYVDDASVSLTVSLVGRYQASYVLSACNDHGCTDSKPVDVVGSLAEAVGYVKASNTGASDLFGHTVVLSGDGTTLVVGASGEDGGATGIDGDQADDSAIDSGAVYVFVRDGESRWSQQAYLKASNTGAGDEFGGGFRGRSLAIDRDGSTLAVGAWAESASATGIDGDPTNDEAALSGAVYVFVREGAGQWSQQAYVKASDAGGGDLFGAAVTLSSDGNVLAVGAPYGQLETEGEEPDPAGGPGAVYVFTRDGMGEGSPWSQQARLEAANAGGGDEFGHDVALSGDGETLAVGAPLEASGIAGIGGDGADDSARAAGAVYVFVREELGAWSQQAYLKASNPDADDRFGWSVALGLHGDTLAVGAPGEASAGSSRLGGDPHDDSLPQAGAAYVFVREELGAWSQQAYLKAQSPDAGDRFGQSLALGHDGSMLAVGAHQEASVASGIGGDQSNDAAGTAGAVYVLVRNDSEQWLQRAYVKAPNPSVAPLGDRFGWSIALSGDGSTLAVGAPFEDGDATGLGGDASSDATGSAGAVYLY